MTGHLRLICAADADGRSHLREQSFCAPFHLSKPFVESGTLVVNVVNPTAGLFAGDELETDVRVENGARLLLTTPSAMRAHRMSEGVARQRQHLFVQAGGFIEVWPEWFIPQAGAAYEQTTEIEVEAGGTLIFCETLAPGRVASGEVFAFRRLDWTTNIRHGGRLVARERYSLKPEDESLRALKTLHEGSYYGCVFAIGEAFEKAPALSLAVDENAVVGASKLVEGGWVVKVLAGDSVVMRKAMSEVRLGLYSVLGQEPAAMRRV